MTAPRPLDRDTFDRLVRHRGDPSFSAFIATEPRGAEVEQLPIHLKNTRTSLEAALEERGVGPAERAALTQPLRDAEDDHDFWQRQGEALAVFGSAETNEMVRLAYPVEPAITVLDRFHLRPLLRALDEVETPLLALSLNDVRLFTVTNSRIQELAYAGPTNIDDVNWFEDNESQFQNRTTVGASHKGVHGQNPEDRDHESRLRFLREVSHHVTESVPAGTPVLVMAVEEHWGPYTSVAQHRVHDFPVHGSPHGLSAAQVLEQVGPALDRIAQHLTSEVGQVLDGGRSAGRYEEDPVAIAHAALGGRVDTLVLATGAPAIPASIDEETLDVSLDGSGGLDLLDEAARHTWSNGGTVHVVDVITGSRSEAAAVLRY